jgi:carbon storage regulator
MLVISRKAGEKLRIGDDVQLVVLEISGSRVVIGIDAPREVVIRRLGLSHAENDGVVDADDDVVQQAEPAIGDEISATDAGLPGNRMPFEYPTRAVESRESGSPRAPVITVRRSRKAVIPPPTDGN